MAVQDRAIIDGNEVRIPAYAKESTLINLLDAVKDLAKAQSDSENTDILEDIRDDLRSGTLDFDDAISEFSKSFSSVFKDSIRKIGSAILTVVDKVGGGMLSYVGGLIKTGALALIGSLGLSVSSIKDTLDELRNSFGELNKVGLNLSAGFGENLALGTEDLMHEFMGMGLTLQELTGMMTSNSFAMAANRKTFLTTAKTFKDLSNFGIAYGLTVAESNSLLADELDFKSKMLFQDQIRGEEAAAQADSLFRQQMGYTKLLGKSIDEIRKSAQDVLKSSSSAQSLIALQGKVGAKTLTGLNSFASGLIASGVTEDFTAALLEAGTGIDMFAHEATRQAFTTLTAAGVDIYGTMSTFRDLAMSGNLSVENAADQVAMFRDQIANISDEGMSQLRMMAAAGDAGAQQMISMVVSVKQAKKSAKELAEAAKAAGAGDISGEEMYDRLQEVDKNFKLISGSFARFRQYIAVGLLPAIQFISKVMADPKILTALTEAGKKINKAITGMTGADGLPGLVDVIVRFIDSVSNTVVSIVNYFQETFKTETTATGEKITPTLTEMVSNFLGNLFDNLFGSLLAGMAKLGLAVVGTGLALALVAWNVGKFAAPSVIAGTASILGISAAIWVVSEAMQNFSTIDVGKAAMGLTLAASAIGGLLVLGKLIGASRGALLKPLAIGLGVVAGTIGVLGLAVRAFPFDELTNMLTALTKLGEVKSGTFTSLAGDLKPLAEAVVELTNAATGGVGATIGSALKGALPFGLGGKAQTPIGMLANDLERLAAIARTLPPAMTTTGVGSTPVSTVSAPGQSQTTTTSGAAVAAPVTTKEQALLAEIVAELKKSIMVLKNIQQTTQNSAT